MIIIKIIFTIIFFVLICQVIIVKREIKKRNSLKNQTQEYVIEGNLAEYAKIIDVNDVVATGKRNMDALEQGKIKKQLLHNDAPVYHSEEEIKKYLDFITGSALFDSVMNLEDGRYKG